MAEKVNCVKAKSKLDIYNFEKEYIDKVLHFQILKLEGTLFFWIGDAKHSMSNLCVAVNTKYDDIPAVAALLGDPINITCSSLAQRLAKKTKKQCYISYNDSLDKGLLAFVEDSVLQEMNENPQHF